MSADDRDREERIEQLKVQAASLADGLMVVHESEAMPSELRERFWQTVVAAETAGTTDLITELKAIGVDLPEPDALDDDADEKTREAWRKEYPDLHVPPREPLPYDRDRHLPGWP